MLNYLTYQQKLLLKAVFLHEPEAFHACQKWLAEVDIERLDGGSNRLLPQLYRKISQYKITPPELPRLKGLYRWVWTQNQHWLPHIVSALEPLNQSEIPNLLLGDAANTLGNYSDIGLRPIGTFCLWVPNFRIADAVTSLQVSGWTPTRQHRDPKASHLAQLVLRGRRQKGYELHLCHRLPPGFLPKEEDIYCWERGMSMTIQNVSTRVMSPADHLLQFCLESKRVKKLFLLSWLSDIMTLLKQAEMKIDWDHVLRQAERFLVVLPLRVGISSLVSTLEISVPQTILSRLNQMPVTPYEEKTMLRHVRRSARPHHDWKISRSFSRFPQQKLIDVLREFRQRIKHV